MSTFTKTLLTVFAVLALIHLLAGDWWQAGFTISFAFLFYMFDKAVQERDQARQDVASLEASAHSRRLRESVNVNDIQFRGSPDYMVTPEQFERIMEVINAPPPPSPGHYSVGGTTPHLCVCGKPLEDHQ